MQTIAINPLTPVVPGAKETLSEDDENFLDSLRSVHGKSDFLRNRKPEPKTRQDGAHPPGTHSGPADIPAIEQMSAAEPGGQVTSAEGPPDIAITPLQQISETIQLKVQKELPPVSSLPIEWPERRTTLVAGQLSGRGQDVSPLDFRFVELIQKTGAGESGQAATQVDTVADLTYTCFVDMLGQATSLTAETISEATPMDQRYRWTAGRFATTTATGHNAQEAVSGLTELKISEQVLAENKEGNQGKDILWGQLATSGPSVPHPSGAEKTADFITSFIPAQNTLANPVNSQDNSAARSNQGIVIPEHRIVDNVIQQVSLRAGLGQSNSISIRLHPEELGHMKMDLQANNENIKAHIHVQTQLTQEILAKHLHRLREGFAQQGLVLNEIQVSIDSGTSSGPGLFDEQRSLHAWPHHANAIRPREARQTIMAETVAAPFVADSRINLRI